MSPRRGIPIREGLDRDRLGWNARNFGAISGEGYPSPLSGGSFGLVTTQTQFRPFLTQATFYTDALTIRVITEQAASNARLGFYATNDSDGLPREMIEDLGTIDTTTSGTKVATFAANRLLRIGELYWLAIQCDDSGVLWQGGDDLEVGRPTGGGSAGYYIRDAGQGYSGGFPDPATPSRAGGSTPQVLVRVA